MLTHKRNFKLDVRIMTPDEDHIPDFVRTFTLDGGPVSQLLEQDMPEWHARDPILLDLPTGTGKNYFVIHTLVPQAIREGANVLILSNRVAVSVQQKLSLMPENDLRRTHLTPAGLRSLEDLGPVRVLTYQRLAAFVHEPGNEAWIRQLKYVVADEAHFFASDARFNPECGHLLKLVTSRFCHAIRIYLTATSWDILYLLCQAEQKNYHDYCPNKPWEPKRSLIRYWIAPDYHDIHVSFFTDYSPIIEAIQNDQNDKWLIFVETKEEGKRLQKELSDVSQYLDAERKDTDTWQEIVETEQFTAQVLITTSVLDNGVNICDDRVRHIVIASDDRTSILQSLGRKRRRPGEVVDLRIRVPSDKQLAMRSRRCTELLGWEERFSACITREQRQALHDTLWRRCDPELQKLFIPHLGDIFRNEPGFFSIRRKQRFYKRILEGETTFRDEVLQWLDVASEKSPPLDADLQAFYQEHGNTVLDETLFSQLRKIIVDTYAAAGKKDPQPRRADRLGEDALNNRLMELALPYRIQSDQGNRRLVQLAEKGGETNE